MESEAIALTVLRFQQGLWLWIGSDVLVWEVLRTPNDERRNILVSFLDTVAESVHLTSSVGSRARQLAECGIQPRDALHIASAEAGSAEVMLTTDDHLLKKGRSLREAFSVRIANPADWIREAHK